MMVESQYKPKILVVGSINMDIVLEASRPPKKGETILGEKLHFSPGGKGANQAIASARLHANTSMIGCIGDDAFGGELLRSLKADNINIDPIKKIEKESTGIASILLTEEDNSIIVIPGANFLCSPEHISNHEALIKEVDIIILQLEIPLETVVKSVEIGKRFNKKVILNPAPAKELPEQLLRKVDIITPNKSELAFLTGEKIDTDQNLKEAMEMLIKTGVGQVVTTLGENGCAYMLADLRMKRVQSYKVPVVDTTGAGDAFNAALAYSIALNNDLEGAVTFANKVSALAITKFGAQSGMPYLKEVMDFEKKYNNGGN